MPIVEYEGTKHEFPDDFTDEDIAAALESLDKPKQAAKPTAPAMQADKSTIAAQRDPFASYGTLGRYAKKAQAAIMGAPGHPTFVSELVDRFTQDPDKRALAKDRGDLTQLPLINVEAAMDHGDRGADRGVAKFISSLTTPTNAALAATTGVAGKVLPKAMPYASGAFGAHMLHGAMGKESELDPILKGQASKARPRGTVTDPVGDVTAVLSGIGITPEQEALYRSRFMPERVSDYSEADIEKGREIVNEEGIEQALGVGMGALALKHGASGLRKSRRNSPAFPDAPPEIPGITDATPYELAAAHKAGITTAAEFNSRIRASRAADGGPVPKGPKSAKESAEVFKQEGHTPAIKSARESAKVFEENEPYFAQEPRDAGPVPKGSRAQESAEFFAREFPPPVKSAEGSAKAISETPGYTGVPEMYRDLLPGKAKENAGITPRDRAGVPGETLGSGLGGYTENFIGRDPKSIDAAKRANKRINFTRLNISPEEKGHLQRLVAEYDSTNPKTVESQASVIKTANESTSTSDIDTLLSRSQDPQLAHNMRAATYALRQRVNSLSAESLKAQKALTEAVAKAAPPEQIQALEGIVRQRENDFQEMFGALSNEASQRGRDLAMFKQMADSTWDVNYWVNRARRESGIPTGAKVPEHLESRIREILAEGESATTPAAKTAARTKLAQVMAKTKESGWLETLTALRKAGLLTGAKTHMRNIGGNAAFQVMEEAAKMPASLVDMALSTYSGRRTVAETSPMAFAKAVAEASTKGIREAGEILKSGTTQERLAHMDVYRELNFQKLGKFSPVVNGYVNGVFRSLAAEDQVFRVYAMKRALQEQARLKALNEVHSKQFTRKQLKEREKFWNENPTEQMAAEAIAYSEFATFNSKNKLSQAVSVGKSQLPDGAKAAVDFVVPFVRTPTNVFARLIDYTPVGAGVKVTRATIQAATKGLKPEVQKTFSEAIGRGAIGSGILYLGYMMAKDGKAEGNTQVPGPETRLNEAAGIKAGAIKIGKSWHQVSSLSPVGTLFVIGATLYQQEDKDSKKAAPVGMVAEGAKVAGRTMLEQPMLEGLSDVVSALESPDRRGAQVAGSMAGSVVPTLINDIGTATDDKVRETKGSIGDKVKSRIPGLRTTLPPKLDVTGRPIPNSPTNAINPFLSSEDRTTPQTKELKRLGMGLTGPAKRPEESTEEFNLRSRIRSELRDRVISSIITDPRYKALKSDTQRKEVLERAMRIDDSLQEFNRLTRLTDAALKMPASKRVQYLETLKTKFGITN